MSRLNLLKMSSGVVGLTFVVVSLINLGLKGVGLIAFPIYVTACSISLSKRRRAEVFSLILFILLFIFSSIGIVRYCNENASSPGKCVKEVFEYFYQASNWIDPFYYAHLLFSIVLLTVIVLRKKEVSYP